MRVLCLFFVCLCVVFGGFAAKASSLVDVKEYGTNVDQNPYKGRTQVYTDSQTGDIITSVRPKRQPKNSTNDGSMSVPIYVYPQVTPGHGGQPPYPPYPRYPQP